MKANFILFCIHIILAQYFAEDKPYYYTYSEVLKYLNSMADYQELNEFQYPCLKVQCSTSGTKCLMIGPEEAENTSSTKTDLQDDDKEDVILLAPTACGSLITR
jgi:hypothetical protein